MQFPVERPVSACFIGSLAAVAGAVTVIAWCLMAQQLGWRHAAGVFAWTVSVVWWFVAWRQSPVGLLRWTGAEWRWLPGAQPAAEFAGRLTVHLDAQRVLLVRWQPLHGGGLPLWFWLERRADPLRWPDLRRAVYSPARTDSVPDSSGGAGPALAPP